MASTEDIEGRLVALELLMRGFVVYAADQQTAVPPQEFLNNWERSMKASLQNLKRPIGPSADRIWERAVQALEEYFSVARDRLNRLDGR